MQALDLLGLALDFGKGLTISGADMGDGIEALSGFLCRYAPPLVPLAVTVVHIEEMLCCIRETLH